MSQRFCEGTILLGDVGGHKARFALLLDGKIGPIETLAVAEFPGVIEALRSFFLRRRSRYELARAILGIAGPIEGNAVTLTNSGWLVDAAQLRREFGFERVDLINDFAAAAWSASVLPSMP
jgi:glucokinase